MNRNTECEAPGSRIGCIKLYANPVNRSKTGVCGCKLLLHRATRACGHLLGVNHGKKGCALHGQGWRDSNGEGCMALKVELKPHERIIIGACVITNTDQRTKLLIEGEKIPILREKDILTSATADTPAKLVYLAVQLMYLSPDPQAHHPTYFSLMRDMLNAAPSSWPFIEGINNQILNGEVYLALKEAKKLIAHEDKLLSTARDLQKAKSA
jgi:flagellar protein FlbT